MDDDVEHPSGSRTSFWVAIGVVVALVAVGALWLAPDDTEDAAGEVDANQVAIDPSLPAHWRRIDAPFTGQRAQRVVTREDQGLLAVSVGVRDELVVWQSDDAVDWHQTAMIGVDAAASNPIDLSLSTAAGLYFLGTDHGLLVSGDGYTWTETPTAELGEGARVHDVVAHEGELVAVGSSTSGDRVVPTTWTSPDGASWAMNGYGYDGDWTGSLHAVASDGDVLVAVGTRYGDRSNATWTSTDARTWTAGERPAEGASDQAHELFDVHWTGEWLAAGAAEPEGAGLWSSADASTWARLSTADEPSPSGRFTRIVPLVAGTVALEQRGDQLEERAVWFEGPGGWREIAPPNGIDTLPVVDIAAFGDGLVAVGHDVWIWSPSTPAEPVPVTTTLEPTQPTLAAPPPDATGRPPMGSLGSPAPDLPPFAADNEVEQAIVDAVYAAFGGGPYIKGDRSRFEGDVSDAFDEAVERYPQHAEGIAAAVYEVTLLSPTEAEVVFDVIDDDVLVTATTRGRVLLIDGRWTVSQATICEMLRRGGLRCP